MLCAEPDGTRLQELVQADVCVMSAATRVAPTDAELARDAVDAWRRFGKGRHPAGLNFGDTFSYALARRLGQPLAFVGDELAQADITPA